MEMDYVQGLAVETLAAAVGSGSLLDDTLMPEPRLEEHRKQLPDAIRHDLEAIVRDLERSQPANAGFSTRNIPDTLRQRLFDFIYNLDLEQLGQGTVLHELPFLEPDWEFGLPRWEGFLLRPPQPGGTSSRQRASASAAPGQQVRSFTSYTANTPLPISTTAPTTQHVLFITSPCKDHQGKPVGKFRGWVCVDKAEQKPGNGHAWQQKQWKGEGDAQESGWVDVSVALGVWEPKEPEEPEEPKGPEEQQQEARKRSRSGSWPSSTSSLQDELPVQHSPAATASGGGAGTTAAAAAAAAAVLLDPSAHGMGGTTGGVWPGMDAAGLAGQQQEQQALQQLLALQHDASSLLQVPGSPGIVFTAAPVPGFGLPGPSMRPGFPQQPQLPTTTAVPTANPGLVPATAPPAFTGLQTGLTPAVAAAVLPPAVTAAAGGPADAADLNDIVSRLQAMKVEGQHAGCIRQLFKAARTGGDLLACFSSSTDNQQPAEQQQQQQLQQLVDLLLSRDVVDDPDRKRNLLHLVATHSMGANTGARLQQLDVLLGSNAQLAARLMQSTNNNGSTPLMVATTGILDEGHAAVFRRLLQAADAVVLATKTKSGWTVLHCLANAAAKAADAGAEGEQRVALLMQLMKEYVQRVQAVSGQLGSAAIIRAEEAAAMLEDQCLHSAEPGRHYQGQQYMSMLQL